MAALVILTSEEDLKREGDGSAKFRRPCISQLIIPPQFKLANFLSVSRDFFSINWTTKDSFKNQYVLHVHTFDLLRNGWIASQVCPEHTLQEQQERVRPSVIDPLLYVLRKYTYTYSPRCDQQPTKHEHGTIVESGVSGIDILSHAIGCLSQYDNAACRPEYSSSSSVTLRGSAPWHSLTTPVYYYVLLCDLSVVYVSISAIIENWRN